MKVEAGEKADERYKGHNAYLVRRVEAGVYFEGDAGAKTVDEERSQLLQRGVNVGGLEVQGA